MFTGADLHTDRLAANFERSIAWNYRNVEFCPSDVLPGFAMHQTDRDPTVLEKKAGGQRSNSHARARDFDLLGYRYSVLSSVGTAGLNNVINMIPARDPQEYSLLPLDDVAFMRGWMAWTDAHVAWLRNTKTITGLPSGGGGGLLDATAMVLGSKGAMFVYNPTSAAGTLSVVLDHTLGFGPHCGGAATLAVRATGSSNRGFVAYDLASAGCGARLNVSLPATTAMSFEFADAADASSRTGAANAGTGTQACAVFGGAATARMDLEHGTLALTDARGPAGEVAELVVVLPGRRDAHTTPLLPPPNPPAAPPAPLRAVSALTVDGGTPVAMADDCARAEGLCAELFEYHGQAAVRVRGPCAGVRVLLPRTLPAMSRPWLGAASCPGLRRVCSCARVLVCSCPSAPVPTLLRTEPCGRRRCGCGRALLWHVFQERDRFAERFQRRGLERPVQRPRRGQSAAPPCSRPAGSTRVQQGAVLGVPCLLRPHRGLAKGVRQWWPRACAHGRASLTSLGVVFLTALFGWTT